MPDDPQKLAALGALEEARANLEQAIHLLRRAGATELDIRHDVQQAIHRCKDVVEHATDAKDLLELRRKPIFFRKN